jgi:hypothetical protein
MQLQGFDLPGLELSGDTPFSGTIFRLPLRWNDTSDFANSKVMPPQPSNISGQTYTRGDVLAWLDSFAQEVGFFLIHTPARVCIHIRLCVHLSFFCVTLLLRLKLLCVQAEQMLPFLKHVTTINISIINPDGSQQQVSSTHVERTVLWDFKNEACFNLAIETTPQPLGFVDSTEAPSSTTQVSHWLVLQGQARDTDLLAKQLACSTMMAVACRLAGSSPTQSLKGRVYCHLPLPIFTGLPVHLHASFAVSSNRRSLWTADAAMDGMGKSRGLWNQQLLTQTAPRLYAKLIRELVSQALPPEQVYSVFPAYLSCSEPFNQVAAATYEDITNSGFAVFYSPFLTTWQLAKAVKVLPSADQSSFTPTLSTTLLQALQSRNCDVITLPDHVQESCQALELGPAVLTLDMMAQAFHGAIITEAVSAELFEVLLSERPVEDRTFKRLLQLPILPLLNGKRGCLEDVTRRSKPDTTPAEPVASELADGDVRLRGKRGKKQSKKKAAKAKAAQGTPQSVAPLGPEHVITSKVFFLINEAFSTLMQSTPAQGLVHDPSQLFVACPLLLNPASKAGSLLLSGKAASVLNLRVINHTNVGEMLPFWLPLSWESHASVRYNAMPSRSSRTSALVQLGVTIDALCHELAPTLLKPRLLQVWMLLSTVGETAAVQKVLSQWPLVLVQDGNVLALPAAKSAQVLRDGGVANQQLFEQLGVQVERLTAFNSVVPVLLDKYFQPATSSDALRALVQVLSGQGSKGTEVKLTLEEVDILQAQVLAWLQARKDTEAAQDGSFANRTSATENSETHIRLLLSQLPIFWVSNKPYAVALDLPSVASFELWAMPRDPAEDRFLEEGRWDGLVRYDYLLAIV